MRKILLLLGLVVVAVTVALFVFQPGPEAPEPVSTPVADVPDPAPMAEPDLDLGGGPASRERVAPAAIAEPEDLTGPPASYLKALGGVVGRLVEPDGTPVPDMRIDALAATIEDFIPELGSLFEETPPTFNEVKDTTRSDEEGRFRFEGMKPRGIYVLGIDLGGARATVRFVDHPPNPGETVDLGDVVLDPFVVFTGRVVDEDRAPVASARVRATNLPSIIFNFGAQDVRPGFKVAFQEDTESAWRVAAVPAWITRLVDRVPVPQTETLEDGTFRLEGVPMGMISVLVDKDELVSLVHGPVPSGSGGERSVGDLRMSAGEILEGRVVDGDDEPIANAEIMAGPMQELAPAALMLPVATTGEDGTFRAAGLRDVEHVVAARTATGVDWSLVKDIVPGYDEAVIRIGDTYKITVTAFDEAGEIVPRPELAIQRINQLPLHPLLVPPISLSSRLEYKDDGRAVVRELDPGPYSVMVRAPRYAVAKEKADLTEGSVEIEVRLIREIASQVLVIEKGSQEPVHWATVGVFSPNEPERALRRVPLQSRRTDDQGAVDLNGLTEGDYKVAVLHPGYAETVVDMQVPGPPLVVELLAGGVIAGRVHANQEPPEPDRFLAVTKSRDERFPRFTITDANGEFKITHLEPGDYRVTVLRRFGNQSMGDLVTGIESFFPERFLEATVVEGETTVMDIDILGSEDDGPTAKLRGRVTINGQPAVGSGLSYRPQGSWRSRKSAVADEFGRFDFGEVKAGEGQIEIRNQGTAGRLLFGRLARRDVTLAADEVRELSIDVKTGRLRGSVVADRDGRPISAAEIQLRTTDSDNEWSAGTRLQTASDKSGRFEFDTVPAGTYRLTAERGEFADAEVTGIEVPFNGEPPPVEVRLTTGVIARGTVELAVDPQETRFAWLDFRGVDGTPGRGGDRIDLESGKFEVTGLTPGSYEVRVYAGRQRYEPVRLDVPSGGLEGAVIRPTLPPPDDG